MQVLLFSINVGSLFEENRIRRTQAFVRLFREFVTGHLDGLPQNGGPDFVCLHCQELGGKAKTMDGVAELTDALEDAMAARDYVSSPMLQETDVEGPFTALGAMVFVRVSQVHRVRVYSRERAQFVALASTVADCDSEMRGSRRILSAGAGAAFYQSARLPDTSSRKGYLATRWELAGSLMDLVNVHLYADRSNLVARSDHQQYAQSRRTALSFVAGQLAAEQARALTRPAPTFLFGDFNFRLDLSRFEAWLDAGPDAVACVEERVFRLSADARRALFDDPARLQALRRDLDTELAAYNGAPHVVATGQQLWDAGPVAWPPTFTFREETREYAETRPPAWTDRVLVNAHAQQLLRLLPTAVHYGSAFLTDPLPTDHQPVFCSFKL